MEQTKLLFEIDRLRKCFEENEVIKGMSFKVNKGDVVAILGRSGCGKSTLIRCINRLEAASGGAIYFFPEEDRPWKLISGATTTERIRIDNSGKYRMLALQKSLEQTKAQISHDTTLDAATKRSRLQQAKSTFDEKYAEAKASISNVSETELHKHIGMVFQSFNLFNNKNVIDNVMFPQIKVLGRSKEESRRRAEETLERVGLIERKDYKISELSGGQKQRAAIARAIVMDPEVILFDEPTSALDPEMVGEVLQVMRDLASNGQTMLVVTHEMSFAKNVANRVLFLEGGYIAEDTSSQAFFERPNTESARTFIAGL